MALSLQSRINGFVKAGEVLRNLCSGKTTSKLQSALEIAEKTNKWFTPGNVMHRLRSVASSLEEEQLHEWLDNYPRLKRNRKSRKVGTIVAANIPLVGFDDLAAVLLTNNILIIKVSRREGGLLRFISDILIESEPGFKNQIVFVTTELHNTDALIATGSDNTSRYFDYKYSALPSLLRKNRNGIAIIGGSESPKEIELLGQDVFLYFGLGCRSISKIYIPAGYDPGKLLYHWEKYKDITKHQGYHNNYKYQLAISKMNNERYLDTGYLILKENTGISSPIASLYFEEYKPGHAEDFIDLYKERIQCIVGRNHIPFGKAQEPGWLDYADGIDSIRFLSSL